MTENILNLTIEKLAGLGDGLALYEGRRIFVPLTLEGDMVRARIKRKTRDADYAELIEVIARGPGRVKPVCRHFGDCGGCSLQHLDEKTYTGFKQKIAEEAVRKAGFDTGLVSPLVQMPPNSRRRIELKIEGGRLGFYAYGSHRLVEIEECRVLEPRLEALVFRLKPQLVALTGLKTVQINGVDGGYDLLLGGDEAARSWHLKEDKDLRRVSVQEAAGPRTILQAGPVTVTLGGVAVEVPPRAFLQASLAAQERMTDKVLLAAQGARQVLDLFSGIGTYSFPLVASGCEVTAAEGDAGMVEAMQHAAHKHGFSHRLKAVKRDLFRAPFTASELQNYDAVIINPPFTGAKEQMPALAAAKVKKLVMISCNPATFARDARTLKDAGATLLKVLPIDQFTYSSHLEILAEFAF